MYDKAPRSPSYPAISLPDAIERLRILYGTEGTTPADREVIATTLGYTGRNGASDSIIAAISHYGLLEELSNKRLRISSVGLDILLGETGEEQRETAIKEAANSPKLFIELAAEFGNGRFSNRNVESYLIKRGYNPKAAAKATKSFRDTIEFVERETQGERPTTSKPIEEDTAQTQLAPKSPEIEMRVSSAPNTVGPRTVSIPMDGSRDARIIFSQGTMTLAEIDRIIAYLQFLRTFVSEDSLTGDDLDNSEEQ